MMEGDGAALMSCWGDDGRKGGWRLEKEPKEGEELGNAWRDRLRSLIFRRKAFQRLFLILDEHCLGKGDQSIAGGWGRTKDEFLFLDFVLKMEG
jgi:hypothetical protein